MPTARTQLSASAFTLLGAGPMFLQNRGPDPVFFVVDSAAPTGTGDINDWPQHRLGGGGETRDISINFTQNVYARGVGAVVFTR